MTQQLINAFQYQRVTFVMVFLFIFFSCGTRKQQEERNEETTQNEEQRTISTKKVIVFFGNSLTAGYGIDPELAFPGLIQKRLDSLGYDYTVINAGLSGETTASGLNRIEWVLKQEPDIFVLGLGGNDGLRGIDLSGTKSNLNRIIEKVRNKNKNTDILLAGMMIPPNMGAQYTEKFKQVFPEVAEEKNITLIPFLLENVGGERDLNLPDMIHPNEEGHQILAETVWKYLEPLLEKGS